MRRRLRLLACDGFGLLALATSDSERRPEVGERVPRTELPVRLVQVETNNGHERRRRDRRQDRDGHRPGAGTVQPPVEVSQSENAEPSGPGDIWKQQRISRREPRPQRGWQRGARVGRWRERFRERFSVGEPSGGIAR
jgi:hypothetical protein